MNDPLVRITVRGLPAPQGSKKAFRNQHTGRIQQVESSKKVKPWRDAVVEATLTAITDLTTDKLIDGYPLDEAVALAIVFTMPKPASLPRNRRQWPMRMPDLSKLARSTEDALRDAGLFRDDARIVEYLRLAKCFPREDPDALEVPGALIRVWRMHDLVGWQRHAVTTTPPAQTTPSLSLFDTPVIR